KAGGTKESLKFAAGVADKPDRVLTLLSIARAQVEAGDKAGARTTLAGAKAVAAELPDGAAKAGYFPAHTAEGEMLLGDARAALATARAAKKAMPRTLALGAVARVQLKGDRAGAARLFAEAAGELPAPGILRQLAAAGGADRAVALLEKEKPPARKA